MIDANVVNSRIPGEPRGQPLSADVVLYCTSTNNAIHLPSIGGLLCATHFRDPTIILDEVEILYRYLN